MRHKRPITGAGPWQFETDAALGAGESLLYDFPNMEYNKSNGWFRKMLPFDEVRVTNKDGTNPVTADINGIYSLPIQPNSIETLQDAGANTVTLVNEGGTAIAAGDLVVTVAVTPYDADQKAREQKARPAAIQAIRGMVGLD